MSVFIPCPEAGRSGAQELKSEELHFPSTWRIVGPQRICRWHSMRIHQPLLARMLSETALSLEPGQGPTQLLGRRGDRSQDGPQTVISRVGLPSEPLANS